MNLPRKYSATRIGIRDSFGDVSLEMFLEALNTGHIFERMHREWMIQQCRSDGEMWSRSPALTTYRKASDRFRLNLRRQVDRWMDTGRKADGMDIPASRTVDVSDDCLIVGEDELEGTLVDAFCLLESDIYGKMHLGQHGGLELSFAPYAPSDGPHYELFELANNEAARFFVWFFASDWRHNIVKCRKCGMYYVIKNPMRLYKRGTYCRNHSATKSAEVITAKKRREKRKLILRLAAVAYNRLEASEKIPDANVLKNLIADQVNKETPARMKSTSPTSPITIKWVTRNFKEIRRWHSMS